MIIDPGEFYVSQKNEIISTLLGSCVATCLWDPVNHIIGMNHFLLAKKNFGSDQSLIMSDAGRYGIHAMELLINAMIKQGANRRLLQAKAFGGGNVIKNIYSGDHFFAIGDVNSRFVVEFLQNENIPLKASHLGGEHGRVIHFDAQDFSVYMKRIEAATEAKVANEERHYYRQEVARRKSIEQTADQTSSIEIW